MERGSAGVGAREDRTFPMSVLGKLRLVNCRPQFHSVNIHAKGAVKTMANQMVITFAIQLGSPGAAISPLPFQFHDSFQKLIPVCPPQVTIYWERTSKDFRSLANIS